MILLTENYISVFNFRKYEKNRIVYSEGVKTSSNEERKKK